MPRAAAVPRRSAARAIPGGGVAPARTASAAARIGAILVPAVVRGARLVVEVGEGHARDRSAQELLDGGHLLPLFGGHQGEGVADRVHAPRAPDAVHIVLGGVRDVVVDDVRDPLDVDAAGSDVGRDQDLHPPPAEIAERALPLALAPVPVEGGDRVAAPEEELREAVGAVLGAREDDDAGDLVAREHGVEQVGLPVPAHGVNGLGDPRGGARWRGQVDARRILEGFLGHGVQIRRHRGREEHRLALGREMAQDAAQVGRESHVDHAVGFVQYQDFDEVQAQRQPVVEVEEATRRGDQEIEPQFQHPLLGRQRHAAVHDAHPDVGEPGIIAGIRLHLGRQLAGRGEHQGAQALGSVEEPREDRQHERGGLSGAGLRRGDQILAREHQGDRATLDGRRFRVSGGSHPLQNRGGQAQRGEWHPKTIQRKELPRMLLIHRPAAGEFAPYFSRYINLVPGEDLLRALRDGAEGTRQLLEPLSESRGDSRYAEGKWTVKDVLGHVADTERVFAYGFDQDQWTAVTSTAGRTLQSFREELRAVRDASLALFANLDEAAWHRAGSANNVRMSVRALAFVIAGHEIHHQNVLRERYLA